MNFWKVTAVVLGASGLFIGLLASLDKIAGDKGRG